MPLIAATDQPFRNLATQVNKLMDQVHKGYYNFCPSETWTPNVNLYETEHSYLVCVDVAGVDKEKIDLEVTGQLLTIRGTRAVPTFDETGTAGRIRVHVMEIDHGAFCRALELPENISREQINASYRNGLLWIEVPKNEK